MRWFTYSLAASLMLTGSLVAAPGPKTDPKPERTAGEAIRIRLAARL